MATCGELGGRVPGSRKCVISKLGGVIRAETRHRGGVIENDTLWVPRNPAAGGGCVYMRVGGGGWGRGCCGASGSACGVSNDWGRN